MMRRTLAIVVMGLLLVGCLPNMKAYEGPEVNDSQLALIGDGFSCAGCLRKVETGDNIYYDHWRDGPIDWVKLRPGTYTITYEGDTYFSYSVKRTGTIALAADHVYRTNVGNCAPIWNGPSCPWIEDSTTGQVVDGYNPNP